MEATSAIACSGCVGGQCHRCNPKEWVACPACGASGTGGGPDGACLACGGDGTLVRDETVCWTGVCACSVCGVARRVAFVELDGLDVGNRTASGRPLCVGGVAALCVPCLAFALGEALS